MRVAVSNWGSRIWCIDAATIWCARKGNGSVSRKRRALQTPSLATHAAIPPILDRVVTAVTQLAGNLGPTLARVIHLVCYQQTLLGRNRLMVQRRLELLVEALSTLLGGPVEHVLRDAHLIVGTLLLHQLDKQLILLGDPKTSMMSLKHCILKYISQEDINGCDGWDEGR